MKTMTILALDAVIWIGLRYSLQLHNQIEDMKGQTRMYARVRPMDALEKEAGCKEVSTDP